MAAFPFKLFCPGNARLQPGLFCVATLERGDPKGTGAVTKSSSKRLGPEDPVIEKHVMQKFACLIGLGLAVMGSNRTILTAAEADVPPAARGAQSPAGVQERQAETWQAKQAVINLHHTLHLYEALRKLDNVDHNDQPYVGVCHKGDSMGGIPMWGLQFGNAAGEGVPELSGVAVRLFYHDGTTLTTLPWAPTVAGSGGLDHTASAFGLEWDRETNRVKVLAGRSESFMRVAYETRMPDDWGTRNLGGAMGGGVTLRYRIAGRGPFRVSPAAGDGPFLGPGSQAAAPLRRRSVNGENSVWPA